MNNKRVRPYQKNFIMRLTEDDDSMFTELSEFYRLDKSALVRYALSRLADTLPPGTIRTPSNE